MTASRDAIRREIIVDGHGRLDFRASVSIAGYVSAPKAVGRITQRGGWLSVLEHLVLWLDVKYADEGLAPAGEIETTYTPSGRGGIRLDLYVPLALESDEQAARAAAWPVIVEFSKAMLELQVLHLKARRAAGYGDSYAD
jgi:hypothetical protein